MTVRLLVVDDHPVVRAGLVALLGGHPALTVVGEAATGEEAVARARELRPDVVLCDLRLGAGMDGVDVVRALRGAGDAADAAGAPADPAPEVLILTTYDHDADIVRAVEAGAAGYLLKDADTDALVAAVTDAAAGRPVLGPAMERRLVDAMRTRASGLSARETEVLALVAEGLTNREIAGRLFVGEATVKTHLTHVFGKLGADTRTGAVARARAAGLIG